MHPMPSICTLSRVLEGIPAEVDLNKAILEAVAASTSWEVYKSYGRRDGHWDTDWDRFQEAISVYTLSHRGLNRALCVRLSSRDKILAQSFYGQLGKMVLRYKQNVGESVAKWHTNKCYKFL